VALLGELPEHHRVPVVLRHVVGLSYGEISSVLDCPVGTAKANVARGLDRLRVVAAAAATEPSPRHRPPNATRHRNAVPRGANAARRTAVRSSAGRRTTENVRRTNEKEPR
jgi:RNA polymerase sigma-70 factor (ECF subfamily)